MLNIHNFCATITEILCDKSVFFIDQLVTLLSHLFSKEFKEASLILLVYTLSSGYPCGVGRTEKEKAWPKLTQGTSWYSGDLNLDCLNFVTMLGWPSPTKAENMWLAKESVSDRKQNEVVVLDNKFCSYLCTY